MPSQDTDSPSPPTSEAEGRQSAEAPVHVLAWQGSDANLLERARAGGAGAAALLYDRFAPEVNRMVWRLLGADRDHDDIVQEVFFQLLKGMHRVRDAERLRGWVLTVTVNTVRSELRRRSVRRRFLVKGQDAERFEGSAADPQARATLARVFEVLEHLPVDERLAFTLRYVDGQPLEEAASMCGCSLATVKRRISRAEKRFTKLARRHPELAERLERGHRWEGT